MNLFHVRWIRSRSSLLNLAVLAGIIVMANETALQASESSPRYPVLSDAEAWQLLPQASTGAGQPLPVWARMLAKDLPRTTAAYLQLDWAQRTQSPVPPQLRAAMRWVSAHENHCAYAEAYAAADAKRAGADDAKLAGLSQPGYPGWSAAEQAALKFAQKMTVRSDSVTDEEFAVLVKQFSDKQAACMVLLLAYSNFQDRLLNCLGAEVEPGGPLPPAEVAFPPDAFVIKTTPPPPLKKTPLPAPTGDDSISDDAEWKAADYDFLQKRMEVQRNKPTRLPIPEFDVYSAKLPPGLLKGPTGIIWYKIVFGYAPELAVPFERVMRTAGAEGSTKWDRIMGGSLFWVVTKAVECPYCMGHCEMNWEVAGLNMQEIAERSKLLASDNWSSFPPEQQRAYAFARKLSYQPGEITDKDIDQLKQDFGPERALLILFNCSRYNYMVRISNGFQLKLESENVFYDYYNVKAPGSTQPQEKPDKAAATSKN